MTRIPNLNFAGRLVERLTASSCLIDTATGEVISGSDVAQRISGFAQAFTAAGLRPGDRIVIGCTLAPLSSLAYLGAMYAGLVVVPVEDRALGASARQLLRETGAKALWDETERQLDLFGETTATCLHGDLAGRAAGVRPAAVCAQNDLAALMTTSGSSGTPRYVMVNHGNLTANTEAIIRGQRLGNDERAMLILPINYCFGASVLHTHLYQGGGVAFDSRFMFPDKVLHAINSYSCTTFAGVPTVYEILLRRSNIKSIPLPGLRRLLQAGGALAPQSIREMCHIVPTAKFFVMYGQTEATARISCLPPERLVEKLGSAGLPLDNLSVRIMDDEGRDLPAGQTGEIWVRGPSVCDGYLDDTEETFRRFHDGWLRTRDLGRLDQDGYLWITGRQGDFIKIRGLRVSFAEVEAKVATIPGVYECAATLVHHPEAGEALAIFIVPEGEANGVAERVRRALPPQWTCGAVNLVGELPKTANGKIIRSQLKVTA